MANRYWFDESFTRNNCEILYNERVLESRGGKIIKNIMTMYRVFRLFLLSLCNQIDEFVNCRNFFDSFIFSQRKVDIQLTTAMFFEIVFRNSL